MFECKRGMWRAGRENYVRRIDDAGARPGAIAIVVVDEDGGLASIEHLPGSDDVLVDAQVRGVGA